MYVPRASAHGRLRHLVVRGASKGERRRKASPTVVIEIERLSQKVRREVHRMKGFTRFSQIDRNLYIALINPRYDVLPLIRRHFERRYADQRWIIYDTERGYGIFYDMQSTRELRLPPDKLSALTIVDKPKEQRFRLLWKQYFESVNIAQRNNPKAHLRQLPAWYPR